MARSLKQLLADSSSIQSRDPGLPATEIRLDQNRDFSTSSDAAQQAVRFRLKLGPPPQAIEPLENIRRSLADDIGSETLSFWGVWRVLHAAARFMRPVHRRRTQLRRQERIRKRLELLEVQRMRVVRETKREATRNFQSLLHESAQRIRSHKMISHKFQRCPPATLVSCCEEVDWRHSTIGTDSRPGASRERPCSSSYSALWTSPRQRQQAFRTARRISAGTVSEASRGLARSCVGRGVSVTTLAEFMLPPQHPPTAREDVLPGVSRSDGNISQLPPGMIPKPPLRLTANAARPVASARAVAATTSIGTMNPSPRAATARTGGTNRSAPRLAGDVPSSSAAGLESPRRGSSQWSLAPQPPPAAARQQPQNMHPTMSYPVRQKSLGQSKKTSCSYLPFADFMRDFKAKRINFHDDELTRLAIAKQRQEHAYDMKHWFINNHFQSPRSDGTFPPLHEMLSGMQKFVEKQRLLSAIDELTESRRETFHNFVCQVLSLSDTDSVRGALSVIEPYFLRWDSVKFTQDVYNTIATSAFPDEELLSPDVQLVLQMAAPHFQSTLIDFRELLELRHIPCLLRNVGD